jgi:tellurite resistance protein
LLLLMQYRTFARLHFYLSWWAYSFPLAALTIASMLMYHQSDMRFFGMAASALLVVLSGVIVLLGGRTALAIKRGEICVEE